MTAKKRASEIVRDYWIVAFELPSGKNAESLRQEIAQAIDAAVAAERERCIDIVNKCGAEADKYGEPLGWFGTIVDLIEPPPAAIRGGKEG